MDDDIRSLLLRKSYGNTSFCVSVRWSETFAPTSQKGFSAWPKLASSFRTPTAGDDGSEAELLGSLPLLMWSVDRDWTGRQAETCASEVCMSSLVGPPALRLGASALVCRGSRKARHNLCSVASSIAKTPIAGTSNDDAAQILYLGDTFCVAYKPGGVPSHRPPRWTVPGVPEPKPMLQRVRDAVGRRVNLVHRLDLGTSGLLLCSIPSSDDAPSEDFVGSEDEFIETKRTRPPACAVNAALRGAMSSPLASKTYYAITRGEGSEMREKGRFLMDRPIKSAPPNEIKRDARTHFTFLAGCDASRPLKHPGSDVYISAAEFAEGAAPGGWGRASLVRCELETGRWHQIRKHLNGLSMFVLGDSQHGNSHTNREWRRYGLLPELRLALHCSRLRVPPTDLTPEIDVVCPLPPDLRALVDALPPSFRTDAERLAPELFLPWPPDVSPLNSNQSDGPIIRRHHHEDELCDP